MSGKHKLTFRNGHISPSILSQSFSRTYFATPLTNSNSLHPSLYLAGETEIGFYNAVFIVRSALLGGENLRSLLKEIDYHLGIMKRRCCLLSMPYFTAYRETFSVLIDKGKNTSCQNKDAEKVCKELSSSVLYAQRHDEIINLNR